jgi:hypothetical protein
MHQFLKFILFWSNTLHVSAALSVHHQEVKTVQTATGILASANGMELQFHPVLASKQVAVPV